MASATTSSNSQPSISEPHLDVHFSAPGFSVPHPDTVDQLCQDDSNLVFCHGVTIVKVPPEVVVKLGPEFNIIEAKNINSYCAEYMGSYA